ncbi:MAG: hypothetical protein H6811_08000 [Phycisphaeraceae bacterium]|nr:hypothetical protein [Phycisphaeraceae bacterium]
MKDRNGHPARVDETLLLGWIEGDLTEQEQGRVALALGSDEGLRIRLEAMRRDRLALASLPEARAPADLLSSVADALERELLLVSEPASARSAWYAPLFSDRTGRRLAVAAGLLLALGLTAWLGVAAWQSRAPKPSPGTPESVAKAGPNESDSIVPNVPVSPTPSETDLALADEAPTVAVVPTTAASDAATTPARHPMTAERAVALLHEGRLGILLKTTDHDRTLRWFAQRDHDSSRIAVARLSIAAAPEALAALVAPSPLIAPRAFEWAGLILPDEPARSEAPPIYETTDILVLELAAEPATLTQALRALSGDAGHHATFEELEEPLHFAPMVRADSLLWWRQDPSEWSPRARVPVVIQTLRSN